MHGNAHGLVLREAKARASSFSRWNGQELEDQAWMPHVIRDGMTQILGTHLRALDVYEPICQPLADAMRQAGATALIDLCSGSGAPALHAWNRLRQLDSRFTTCTLTDKFPNGDAFTRATAEAGVRASFAPVDAAGVPSHLRGFRTLFTSMHHFDPATLQTILQRAADDGEGIGMFDFCERTYRGLFSMLLAPLAALVLCPFAAPFRWSRLLFTYVIPLIPIVYLIDGILSQCRAHAPDELAALAASVHAPGYAWRVGQLPHRWLPIRITYLMGIPPAARSRDETSGRSS